MSVSERGGRGRSNSVSSLAAAALIVGVAACSPDSPPSGSGGGAGVNTGDVATGADGAPDSPSSGSGSGAGVNTGGEAPGATDGMSSGGVDSPGGSGGGASAGEGGESTSHGSGGSTETGGSDDRGTPELCSFTITASLSSAIPTVGVVGWSTDLAGVTEARIDFDLVNAQPGELNVGSGGPIRSSASSAWLLGLKPERDYAYRITVTAGQTECVSADQFLTAGALANAPTITREAGPAVDMQEVGFILNCGYSTGQATIVDADGEVVWSAETPRSCSRAHMDWSGESMWMMSANAAVGNSAGASAGEVMRFRMDGTGREDIVGLERAHHDFTVLPDGTTAFLVVAEPPYSGIVERTPDGTLSTLVVLNDSSYLSGGTSTHPNALHYWAHDDSYTVSDLDVSSVIHFDRQGTAQWQVGGYCSDPVEDCATMNLAGTHGHHWLESGNLLVFLAGIGTNSTSPAPVVEYTFEGAVTSPNASLQWFYRDTERSLILGDVERLPNGNTLITYSDTGVIQEVTANKELVQTVTTIGTWGYSTFRKTLYGPPQ